MILETKQLTKTYGKQKNGLKDFSITMESGITGLLGPNGAGKSTLMKMLATISQPMSGSIRLNDTDITSNPNTMRSVLGYLPQDFGVYPNLNAYEFLQYVAALKGVGGPQLKDRIQLLLEGLNLAEHAKKPIGQFSGGMRQRIGIAQTLLNAPKVIILDEPTVGLDPEERVRFRNMLMELAHDSIVILSSHIVSDVETIADKIAIMKDGHLLAFQTTEALVQRMNGKVFELMIEEERLANFKEEHLALGHFKQKSGILARFYSDTQLSGAQTVTATLEDAYLYLTKS